jgi:hypothetical protein
VLRLVALSLLLCACAGPPCPDRFTLYGEREWGRIENGDGGPARDRDEAGGSYRGYRTGASIEFNLSRPAKECEAYGGEERRGDA